MSSICERLRILVVVVDFFHVEVMGAYLLASSDVILHHFEF